MFLVFCATQARAQSAVCLTIDDVPNSQAIANNYSPSLLLSVLDSLQLPVAIFINEENARTDSGYGSSGVFIEWIQRPHVTPGNHTFGHLRYSEVGFDAFADDIHKGTLLTGEIARKYNKPIRYFRFPYNDLGNDSLEQQKITRFLSEAGYRIAPFTIESMDWMFNDVFESFLAKADTAKAREIGEKYIQKTLEYFSFFERLSFEKYGRNIRQIYLCHDNALNAHYLPVLVRRLKEQGYAFIDLDQALADPVYALKNHYYKKWGISWLYRWMENKDERAFWMRQEPDTAEIEHLYKMLSGKE